MKPRKQFPGYPDYVKRVTSRGKEYEYFDTGRTAAGKRIYKRLPSKTDPRYGGTYASLLAARMARENLVAVPTIEDVSRAYQKSDKFTNRSQSTQSTYLTYLTGIERQFKGAPINDVTKGDVRAILDKMQGRPGAATMTLLVMRNLVKYALERDWIRTDPTLGIEAPESGDAEHEPWDEALVDLALADPAVGLPVALLLYTGQRIGDVCRMRWSDIRDGYVYVKQQKTGKELDIRLHENLARMLAATPKESLTIIHGPKLRPMRPPTLRLQLQKFAAGHNTHVVPHGLRKNAVLALLEAGCSTGEVSSITGQSLAMVERYARRRNNRRIGTAAILKWEARTKEGNRKLGETA